ncbi:MAG: IS66 family transposase [Breznakibacter sp.]|nr:IS66 family transposase [Breznakibacter sp.]
MQKQELSHAQSIAELEAKIVALKTDLLKKDAVILKNEAVIAEKEAAIADKDAAIADKDAVISEREKTINKLDGDVAYLKFQNEQMRRLIFGSKRERFVPQIHPDQLTINFEPQVAEIEAAVLEERKKIRVEYERKASKKQHPGRMSLPGHLPVNEIIIEPSEDTTGMTCIGQEITEELDYIPSKLVINRYIRNKYITKEDDKANQKQVIAPLERPLHKCIAGTSLVAMLFSNKYLYHLPIYRSRQMLSQLGVEVPESTLESWIRLGADLIRPLYAVHRMHLFKEVYQMIDESPIKVQDSDKKGACHQGYMWVRYAPLSKSVLFEYYKSRSAKGPIDDLASFNGFIQTDGYSGYTYLTQLNGLVHLSCWAHARRYFEQAIDNDHERASHVLKLIQLLYAIEAIARDQNMTHDQRHALRLEKSLPVINEIGAYLYRYKSNVTPKSPIGKAFEYCANRWISLQNYLTNGMLEIDSNLIENAIRPLALGRKNFLFAGSHDAARDIAMFYSFFGTCKKNNIDPQLWLKYVMDNIQSTPAKDFKELLPQFINKELI